MTQVVVSKQLLEAYDDRMALVQSSDEEAASAISRKWWALYEIRRDNLWRARYEKFTEWLGDFSKEPFGESVATYYNVMDGIQMAFGMGLTTKEVQNVLGRRKVATETDLKLLFQKNGKGGLKEEVLAQLEESGETPRQFLKRVSLLPPGEARKEVLSFVEGDQVFFLEDSLAYDPETGFAMVNIQWENEADGLMWKGTIRIAGTEIVSRKKGKPKDFVPEPVMRYILGRLGLKGNRK